MLYAYIMGVLEQIFSSKVRAAIFRNLFGINPAELHMREIQRVAACTIGPVQVELKKLLALQLVTARRDGNRLYYRANREHPLYPDIHAMVLKTSGMADYLSTLLRDRADVTTAFIFGSLASGEDTAASDIDLMAIGTISLRGLITALGDFRARAGRELNPHVFTQEEVTKRLKAGEHFITAVLASPRLFVKGTDHDLAQMG